MLLQCSIDEKALAITIAERSATVCKNVIIFIRKPMHKAKYMTITDSLEGPLLLSSTRVNEAAYAYAEIRCTASSLHISAYTKSYMCELNYSFFVKDHEVEFCNKQFRITLLPGISIKEASSDSIPYTFKAVDIPKQLCQSEIRKPYYDND